MRIAVVTPAVPERFHLLADNLASVRRQTRQPDAHLIHVDYPREGTAAALNRLLDAAGGYDWLAVLADDDVAYPDHLETLAAHTDGADVVYTWCDVEGRNWNPNQDFDPGALAAGNYIPATSLIRRTLADKLGGWRDLDGRQEDWDFWRRAIDAGARFHLERRVTWLYRFHGGNKSG